MKKRLLFGILAVVMLSACFTGCGKKSGSKDMIYAVEAGSAGEAAAKEKDFKYNAVDSQANALMEVSAGTSDAAIVDLLMACAMIGEGTDYEKLKYTDKLTTEYYGIGCRKDSDLADFINYVLYESYKDGSMIEIAKKYKISDMIVEQKECSYTENADGDVAYIKNKGEHVVGITDFAPMDYKEGNEWVGFDADMAKKVAEKLGVSIKFVEIIWDNKIMELNGKTVDVIWNGMTLTDEVKSSMNCTNAYCDNAQVVVVKK